MIGNLKDNELKILFEISHPADAHLFKNLIWKLQAEKHEVFIVSRDKEQLSNLLESMNIRARSIGRKKSRLIGKLFGLVIFTFRILMVTFRFKPDILISHGSMYCALAAWLSRKPSVILDDTGNKEQMRLWKPFATHVITGQHYKHDLGSKQHRYNGFHEMAYLHPGCFKPDKEILDSLDLKEHEKVILVRFVSRATTHDMGVTGLNWKRKADLVNQLAQHGRVFISSETPLPAELEKYKLQLPYEHFHHLLAFADLYFGESATVASEAAMLGVPAIYVDHGDRFYTRELENNYDLVKHFHLHPTGIYQAMQHGLELLTDSNTKARFQANRMKLLDQTINPTRYFHDFIRENLSR